MKLQNIFNRDRTLFLFERQDDGSLKITKEESFFPYYYERNPEGESLAYDGVKVKKQIVSKPKEVAEKRSAMSYEADILFTKRYIVDKIDSFEKSNTKYIFIDIEVLTKEIPDTKEAKYPISSITIWNSGADYYHNWFLSEYKSEKEMLDEFVDYMKHESPDIILGWNIDNFDYPYLFNRIPDFAKRISPIGANRYGEGDMYYPAGISIVDYLSLFKKISMREQSYALDRIAQKYFKEDSWKETDFSTLSDTIREKNINDVKRMLKIEEKFRIIKYFDEIRRFATCLWEDLTFNSKVLDMMILREARTKKIVLPNKSQFVEDEDLEGAYRRAEVGIFYNIYKADVASMYPNQIVNFCLDAQNIIDAKDKDKTQLINHDFTLIEEVLIKQNPEAILPTLSRRLIEQKDLIKKELKVLTPGSTLYEDTKKEYDAIKALVNSLYGVMGCPSFRLYNNTIASTITFLSRDLLKYVEEKVQSKGYRVVYTDTDALMYEAKKDEIHWLNELVKQWGQEKYNKENVDIVFDSEGKFTKLLILGKCHYYGYLETSKGITKEIKGMEIKRSSSSKFEAQFQEALINKILDRVDKEQIFTWIKEETKRIKTVSIMEVALPTKIANRQYKNDPIFVRASRNAKRLFSSFKMQKGELFHYLYVKNFGYDENGKEMNVVAITDDPKTYRAILSHVDWDEMIRRNIISKTNAIFEALNWGSIETYLERSLFGLFRENLCTISSL